MPLERFSFIVDDYDAAITFFTETLRFVLAEDAPAATTTAERSAGSWCDPSTAARDSWLLARMAPSRPRLWGTSSPAGSACFCE